MGKLRFGICMRVRTKVRIEIKFGFGIYLRQYMIKKIKFGTRVGHEPNYQFEIWYMHMNVKSKFGFGNFLRQNWLHTTIVGSRVELRTNEQDEILYMHVFEQRCELRQHLDI